MISEWEQLESLSKEELIMELVRMRNLYGILREDIGESTLPYMVRKRSGNGAVDGEPTTPDWAERIALYAAMHPKDGAFYPCDLMDYGMTGDQSYEVCEKLYAEGRLKVPEGTEIKDLGQEVG